jgi:Spy/CpxP family protein refolding chaperone
LKQTLKYIAFGAICAGLALAQGSGPDPAAMVQHQVQRLTTELSLNSAQQAQATTIFTTEQTANQPIMASMQQARTSLTAAIKSNNTADIATLSGQIGNLEGQMMANAATANAAFYAILTQDQQAKYHVGVGGFAGRGFGGPAGSFRGHGGGSPQ